MPIVHIYLLEGKPQTYLQALGDSIHQALVETWGLPESDRFQIFHEKKAEHFKIDRFSYLEDEGDRDPDNNLPENHTHEARVLQALT
jgi:phenylpyruvate tautomerase PptA (4-oxalocrotonate tautomerase family)